MSFQSLVTFCYTPDLAATVRFYEEVVGLECVLDQGTCRIYRVAPTGYVGFCEREEVARPDGVILTFVTPDVDAWFTRMKDAGAQVEKEPAHNERFNIYHCFLRDPNGYLIELQKFLDPAWPDNQP